MPLGWVKRDPLPALPASKGEGDPYQPRNSPSVVLGRSSSLSLRTPTVENFVWSAELSTSEGPNDSVKRIGGAIHPVASRLVD
jgi:hypothetical protein